MTHINSRQLIAEATHFASRADYVGHDPAVLKAGKVAARDIVQAVRSTADFAGAVSRSWASSGHGEQPWAPTLSHATAD